MSFTWNSAQNLIGGMAFGFEKEFGNPQQIITGFAGNDKLYIDYKNNQHKENIPVVTMSPDYKEIKEGPELEKVDIYAMTPICSGLSMLNSSKTGDKARGDADNCQNQNMYNLTELAMTQEAKVIAFENAPTLYTDSGKGVCQKLDEIAKRYGYSMQLVKTNTILHGVGQNRPRTFSMFYRDTNPPKFEFEKLPYKPFWEYCDEVKNSEYSGVFVRNLSKDKYYEFILNDTNTKDLKSAIAVLISRGLKPRNVGTTQQLARACGPEKCLEYLKSQLNGDKDHDDIYQRHIRWMEHSILKNGAIFDSSSIFMHTDYINALISKNIGYIIPSHGNVQERFMDYAEMLHMMAMPTDYHIEDLKHNWLKVTQNVPVCTANYIARQIKKYLNGELELATTRFVKQNNTTQHNDLAIFSTPLTDW